MTIIAYTDGTVPNENFIRTNMLTYMNSQFNPAGVTVTELNGNSRRTFSTPILTFSQESHFELQPSGSTIVEWGNEMRGGVRPKVFLGNFKTAEFNNRFNSNGNYTADQRLARALSFLSLHELGHSHKLGHRNGILNIMRSPTTFGVAGNGLGGLYTSSDILNSLLRNDGFSQDQIVIINYVAITGRKN